MKKTLIEIYALAVCFVTIICFAVSLGVGLYDLLEISNPEFTLKSRQYEKHQTNDAFTRSWNKKQIDKYSEEEITSKREDSYRVALTTESRNAIQSFIRMLIIILIDLVMFFSHWKLARRERELPA